MINTKVQKSSKVNGLFLVDWGKKCNGARYAIIEGATMSEAFHNVECQIGYTEDMRLKALNSEENKDEALYIELCDPDRFYQNHNNYVGSALNSKGVEDDVYADWVHHKELLDTEA
jgi:hypothetical protein